MVGRLINTKQYLERELAEETEVLGEVPSQWNFVHHKSDMAKPGIEPEPRRWKTGD
jgi:hypothetical protein